MAEQTMTKDNLSGPFVEAGMTDKETKIFSKLRRPPCDVQALCVDKQRRRIATKPKSTVKPNFKRYLIFGSILVRSDGRICLLWGIPWGESQSPDVSRAI